MFSEVLIQVTVDGEFGKRSPPARQIFQTSAFHLMPTQIIMQAAEVDRRLARAGSLSSSSSSEGETGEAPPPPKKKKEDPMTRTGVTMETVSCSQ